MPIDSTYYLGNLRISGTITINGSSLLLPSDEENYNSNKYNVKDVSFVTTNTEDGDKIALLLMPTIIIMITVTTTT